MFNKDKVSIIYKEIPYCSKWKNVNITLITKGFSNEYKYLIQHLDANDNVYEKVLLRIAEIKQLDDKIVEFNNIKVLNNLTNSFIMTRVIEMGTFKNDNYVWILTNWIEGTDFRDDLLNLSNDKQYELGVKAGKLLKIFHSTIVINNELKEKVYRETIDRKLKVLDSYEDLKELRFHGDQVFLKYIRDNLDKVYKLNHHAMVLKHGDYHVGNMVLTKGSNDFAIIDFNRCCYGYAFDEFYKLEAFNVELSIEFSVGQIDGYFNINRNQILEDSLFWYSFKTFVAMASISGIYWARSFDKDIVDGMTKRAINSSIHFNNFNNDIPTWYLNFKNQIN